ncbi:MAG: hypothetical protein Q4E47_00255 [Candidatus Saccharibacteria bacterium]|nr:hypothetical protein [Candidatus Saccharibacteria bacterium]
MSLIGTDKVYGRSYRTGSKEETCAFAQALEANPTHFSDMSEADKQRVLNEAHSLGYHGDSLQHSSWF